MSVCCAASCSSGQQSDRIASHCVVPRATMYLAPHRTAVPRATTSTTPPPPASAKGNRGASSHTPAPCHQRTLRIRGCRRGARRRRSLTGALRLCRPPRFPPFRPASSLSGDGPSGALVRWRVAGGSAVCLQCGVLMWKCCSDAARVVQDARVVRDEMR
jgi:hypothetical protein